MRVVQVAFVACVMALVPVGVSGQTDEPSSSFTEVGEGVDGSGDGSSSGGALGVETPASPSVTVTGDSESIPSSDGSGEPTALELDATWSPEAAPESGTEVPEAPNEVAPQPTRDGESAEGEPGLLPETAPTSDSAWAEATRLLEAGDLESARQAFRDFAVRFPTDRRATLAVDISATLAATITRPYAEARLTGQTGRVETAIFSTIWGLGSGVLLGVELIGDDSSDAAAKVPLWTSIGMGIGGLVLSLRVTADDPPTEGQAGLISAAGVWGYAIGGEIIGGTKLGRDCHEEPDYDWGPGEWCDDPDPHLARLLPFGLSTVSIASAIYFAGEHPDLYPGDLAVANAGAIWGTVTSLFLLIISEPNSDLVPLNYMLGGTTLGLAGGALLASAVDVSRGRMRLISLSGVLGVSLVGALDATAELDNEEGIGLTLLLGEALGLAAGVVATSNRDNARDSRAERFLDDLAVTPLVVPDAQGGVFRGLSLSGSW